jgi:phytol kinase
MSLSGLLSNPWINDVLALFVSFIVALSWLRLNDALARRRILSRELSRKLIHIGTGPLFILCWLFFSNGPQSRWLAALVPGLITLQFLLIGLGRIQDDDAVQAMSRTGDYRELLYGPVQYGVVFLLLTLLFWLNSPVGIVALLILCVGDGVADLMGRRFGRTRLPFNPNKSWAGSASMLVAGFVVSLAYLALFNAVGVLSLDLVGAILPVMLICLAATVIEAVSGPDMDNVTVTVAAVGMAWLLTDATGFWDVPFMG